LSTDRPVLWLKCLRLRRNPQVRKRTPKRQLSHHICISQNRRSSTSTCTRSESQTVNYADCRYRHASAIYRFRYHRIPQILRASACTLNLAIVHLWSWKEWAPRSCERFLSKSWHPSTCSCVSAPWSSTFSYAMSGLLLFTRTSPTYLHTKHVYVVYTKIKGLAHASDVVANPPHK
jgi:hypothetical protein